MKDDTKKIKIKKIIMGIDAYQGPRKLYVQVTKDDIGTSISIENFTIPIEPLGLELREVEEWKIVIVILAIKNLILLVLQDI